jgi:hypothetical protein
MCWLCDQGKPQKHSQLGRRDFLKLSTAAAGASFLNAPAAQAHDEDDPPRDSGRPAGWPQCASELNVAQPFRAAGGPGQA